MKKLLLTGATGFLGRALLNLLQHIDYEVHATFNTRAKIDSFNNIKWHHCNVLANEEVSDLLAKIKPNYLIHLAWILDHKTFWMSEMNFAYYDATIEIYNKFSLNGGHMAIFIGTCAEYDKAYSVCHEQETPLKPDTLYGLCKKQAYETIRQLHTEKDLAPFSWVRLFNLYGAYESIDRLIPYIFLSYLNNQVPFLKNPLAVRDYSCVDDIAWVLIRLLESVNIQTINIGSGTHISLEELANKIQLLFFPKQAPARKENMIVSNDCLVPNIEQLKHNKLAFKAELESKLERTYCYWKNYVAKRHEIILR